jgi:hypothetical protein
MAYDKYTLIANWHATTQRREHLVNENFIHENRKCSRHDYVISDKILKKWFKPSKLGPRTSGPYRVTQTQVNGMITSAQQQGVTGIHTHLVGGQSKRFFRSFPFDKSKWRLKPEVYLSGESAVPSRMHV